MKTEDWDDWVMRQICEMKNDGWLNIVNFYLYYMTENDEWRLKTKMTE
jgi:hypothetical protein